MSLRPISAEGGERRRLNSWRNREWTNEPLVQKPPTTAVEASTAIVDWEVVASRLDSREVVRRAWPESDASAGGTFCDGRAGECLEREFGSRGD